MQKRREVLAMVKKNGKRVEKKTPDKGPLEFDALSHAEIDRANAAYENEEDWQVYANYFGLDGERYEIIENKEKGNAIVFELAYSEARALKGENPYSSAKPILF